VVRKRVQNTWFSDVQLLSLCGQWLGMDWSGWIASEIGKTLVRSSCQSWVPRVWARCGSFLVPSAGPFG
jgi:hypothetical protein